MPGGERRGESGGVFFPDIAGGYDDDRSAGGSDDRAREDIRGPMDTDIHSTETYQCGGDEGNPAAPEEKRADGGEAKAIRGV